MAVSNGLGSQICNICVGLGKPIVVLPRHACTLHVLSGVAVGGGAGSTYRYRNNVLRCGAVCCVLAGMPGMLSTVVAGVPIYVSGPRQIQVAARFQFVNIAINFSLLLGAALVLKQNKAELTREKGLIFLGTYAVMLTGYAIYIFG